MYEPTNYQTHLELFKSVWRNNATIQVLYYNAPPTLIKSDVIELSIKPTDGRNARTWLMNVQDATDIIYGLSKAMSLAIENEIPTNESNLFPTKVSEEQKGD